MAELIDGRAIAKQVLAEVQSELERLRAQRGLVPALTVILVGDDPASKTYVSSKAKTCSQLGMISSVIGLPATTSESELLDAVDRLNANPAVHGILVQLPLPPHIRADRVIERIHPSKDVDGLHPLNVGLLCSGRPRFIPCTPLGIRELLRRSQVDVRGREVVILGRSNLVGRPLSILLSSKGTDGDAIVTLCHSQCSNLAAVCRRADVLVVAIGKPAFVTREMVKPGAVVVDVGIHPPLVPGGRLRGDVDFASVEPVASKITPVPGGVGPMTIAMLMHNTLVAAMQ